MKKRENRKPDSGCSSRQVPCLMILMRAPETACWNSWREESLPVEEEKAPANAENQEAPVGDKAAVETTAAEAPLVDPSRETETEELEEIEDCLLYTSRCV